MRRLTIAALLAALIVVVLLPARADANHTLAHKVRKLQGKVTVLQRKMNCLRRTGASTYFGYAYYDGTLEPGGGPYPVHDPAEDIFDTDFAVNFDQLLGISPSDYWLLTINNTRSCRRKFKVVRNPYAARVATRTATMAKLHRLARAQ